MADKAERLLLDRLAEIGPAFAQCRYARHHWDHQGFAYVTVDNRMWIVSTLRCLQCKTERQDFHNRHGDWEYRHYSYADGYVFRYSEDERDAGVRLTTRNVGRALIRAAVANGEVGNAKVKGNGTRRKRRR